MKPLTREWVAIPRTHNLETLARPLLAAHPALSRLAESLRTLTAYAVETRYPGKSSDRSLAREAVARCKEIRTALRGVLRLAR